MIRETARERLTRFQEWCKELGYSYHIDTDVSITPDGEAALAKATVSVFQVDSLPDYKATGNKMVYFKDEVTDSKDTSAYSAAETMAISRALGFILPGLDDISTEEEWNAVILQTLRVVSEKLNISEIEARRYIETLRSDELREHALRHLGNLITKRALSTEF